MNKLILIGNLGQDPTMRYTPAGQAVTNFSVASNHRYKTASGEQREEVEWFSCQAWGRLAEITNEHLRKGSQVYIEGRLKSRTYETQNGNTRFSNDITVTEVQFLGKPVLSGAEGRDGQGSQGDDSGTDDDLDLPF